MLRVSVVFLAPLGVLIIVFTEGPSLLLLLGSLNFLLLSSFNPFFSFYISFFSSCGYSNPSSTPGEISCFAVIF